MIVLFHFSEVAMSEELTIKWINGELPDGWYYIEVKDTVSCKEYISMKDGLTLAYLTYIQQPFKKFPVIRLLLGRIGYKSVRRIVAEVPTYKQYEHAIQ